MKLTKIFSGIMVLLMGAAMLTACSDKDDYYVNTGTLLTDGSVVTGSSDVTATTATFHGSVTGLENINPASYATGFKYGFSQNALTETATSVSAAEFSASLSGLLNNQVIYYQAYVTLQGKLTYTGEVKSLITTDATATTGDATDIDFAAATIAGSISKYPENATAGIVISTTNDEETVRAGLRLANASLEDNYAIAKTGLLSSTTYYYAAYLDLGPGVVYGEVKEFTTETLNYDADEDFVDLGLSVKWAKCNIGARTETEVGGLFAFGDLTGTNPSIDPADYASVDTYKTVNDLAYQATGGIATLPTADLFEELFRLCKTEWMEADGVSGYLVTAKNGNSIFLPATGKRVGSDITEEGIHGFYLTGTVNATNKEFAVDYEFTASAKARSTRATYEALAVRPVTVARNVKFDKSFLYQKWYLDNGQDGKQHVYEGPFTQWGVHDTWGTIQNNEPNPYESVHWEMGKDNGWIGYTYGVDYGYMEFKEDGKVFIHRLTDDGQATDEEGTFTIDETNKTVTIDINILCANTWIGTKSGTLHILALDEDGLRIALPADNTYAYSLNYYSQAKAEKDALVDVSLMTVGSDWGPNWGTVVQSLAPEELEGQHTFTYEGYSNGAMVTLIDFVDIMRRYPNTFVRIDEIKLDGTAIKFNANNFCYGDIENSGNYRIEMFNIWGKGAENGLVKASPFSNLTNVGSDPAFTFANELEITYTIMLNGPEGTYTPNLITINPNWGGTWGFNSGATFDITLNTETAKYEISKKDFTIKYESADHAAGSIMTFVQIDNIRNWFPTMHSTLNSCKLNGINVTFDASKVVDSSEGAAYRLELWNMYGTTSQSGCGFGTADASGVVHELGFSSSMELDFTIKSLFAIPEF
ncbi:MAG: hypothetical protein IJV17_05890 [Prevotella sp.]|nr:hypothetical protein [Prevotella sp.]